MIDMKLAHQIASEAARDGFDYQASLVLAMRELATGWTPTTDITEIVHEIVDADERADRISVRPWSKNGKCRLYVNFHWSQNRMTAHGGYYYVDLKTGRVYDALRGFSGSQTRAWIYGVTERIEEALAS